MSTDLHDHTELKERLWSEIQKQHTGMLGLMNEHRHFQPMTAFGESGGSVIWFFTRTDTDLATDAKTEHDAMFILMAKDQEFQACISGDLTVAHDQGVIDTYWNAHVAAWYPDGKDDPKLTLLKMECRDAALWISKGGVLRYAFEVTKANMSHKTPDIGGRADVRFN